MNDTRSRAVMTQRHIAARRHKATNERTDAGRRTPQAPACRALPPREAIATGVWACVGPGSVVAGAARALGACLLGVPLLVHAHAHVALLAHLVRGGVRVGLRVGVGVRDGVGVGVRVRVLGDLLRVLLLVRRTEYSDDQVDQKPRALVRVRVGLRVRVGVRVRVRVR